MDQCSRGQDWAATVASTDQPSEAADASEGGGTASAKDGRKARGGQATLCAGRALSEPQKEGTCGPWVQ